MRGKCCEHPEETRGKAQVSMTWCRVRTKFQAQVHGVECQVMDTMDIPRTGAIQTDD